MTGLIEALGALRQWPTRRWTVAAVAAAVFVLVVGVPTALIDTGVFARMIPPTWWAWPALITTALLVGMLIASYVRGPEQVDNRGTGAGFAGGFLTFLAVGCPVCNKLVLLALGSAGAMTWFAPVQPVLQLLAIGLLVWALLRRLRFEYACPAPQPSTEQANV